MDISTMWVAIQEIQKSISIINAELGKTMNDVAWLKASFWELMSYIRIITGGIVVGIILNIWNLFSVKRNNKK